MEIDYVLDNYKKIGAKKCACFLNKTVKSISMMYFHQTNKK